MATILISNAPAGALRVGDTAQLAVTALSPTGSTISGAFIEWRSSNEAVAVVTGSGLVSARAAGKATVTASSGEGSASMQILVVTPLTINLAGGAATVPDGSLTLTVPPGSRSGTVTFLVGPAADSLADDRVVPGTIYQLTAESGTGVYLPGATLTLRYDPARVPTAGSSSALQLYARTSAGWTGIRGSRSDPAARVVRGAFSGPGTYAVRLTPVDRILLSGAHVDGALYVGQSARLAAVAVTAGGDTLAGPSLTWTSSSPDVARVDSEGRLTAVGPGSATITASAESTSAATTVQVLARPVASWAGERAWTTFRGNNRRTGFVNATLDPVRFTRRWEVTLPATGSFHEPATGDGNVYVSTNAYFGAQALWALDVASGATRWTRAFGAIHSVNGPATGHGRVFVSTGGHGDSFLWSFDAADGTVRFRSAYGNQWSRWQAPAVTDGTVFLGGGYYGGMSAFDALEGTVLWRRNLPQEDGWTPAAEGGRTYAFGDGGLLALDGRTGVATLEVPNRGLPSAGTPVLGSGEHAFVISSGRLQALDLAGDVVTWDRPGTYQGVPALDDTHVYAVVNGQVEARSRTDGALRWTWIPQAGMTAYGSLIVTRNLLFVRLVPSGHSTSGGRVVALDLDSRRVVWSYDADGEMALGEGLLILTNRSGGRVTAIAVQ